MCVGLTHTRTFPFTLLTGETHWESKNLCGDIPCGQNPILRRRRRHMSLFLWTCELNASKHSLTLSYRAAETDTTTLVILRHFHRGAADVMLTSAPMPRPRGSSKHTAHLQLRQANARHKFAPFYRWTRPISLRRNQRHPARSRTPVVLIVMHPRAR